MSAATLPKKLTLDDVDDPIRYEIVDGELVEMEPMSVKASTIASELSRAICGYTASANLGKSYTEVLIKLRLKADRQRRPDVIHVSYATWPKDKPIPDDWAWPLCPDLCVEVVSPSDRSTPLMAKVSEYFKAGVKAVWVVYPERALVHVYESMDSVKVYQRDKVLPGGDAVPGLQLNLSDILPEASEINAPDDD